MNTLITRQNELENVLVKLESCNALLSLATDKAKETHDETLISALNGITDYLRMIDDDVLNLI